MNDSEIIDWLQSHITFFHEVVPHSDRPFNMGWLDDGGVERTTAGVDLRDCVRGAIADKQSNDD